jgi:hydroxymethylpyrimidine pyrophosphatase-like HAD family hydrolase
MPFRVLATDYDGTLAGGGRIPERTASALARLRASGCRIVLVTGRIVDDLARVCPRLDLFDLVVAENGAVLLDPARRAARLLADAPPPLLAEVLRARGVVPIASGRVILATHRAHEAAVRAAISSVGLEFALSLNRESLMVLPGGVDKRTGLAAALADLSLAFPETVGVGDAENDEPFVEACGCGVAVANAVASLRERADLVTSLSASGGVEEVVERLLSGTLPAPRVRVSSDRAGPQGT